MLINLSFQPIGKTIEVEPDISILDAVRKAGIGISAVCGGKKSCGSCLVKIPSQENVSKPTDMEIEKLDKDLLSNGYRLACQTIAYQSTIIEIPPESLTANQRSQVEGIESSVAIDPVLEVYDIDFSLSQNLDSKDEWSQFGDVLLKLGLIKPKSADYSSLLQFSSLIDNHGKLRCAIYNGELLKVCAPDEAILGVAIDIGTTKIAAYLIDMLTGDSLAQSGISNPQISYGEDIMARISYANEEKANGELLKTELIKSFNALVEDQCKSANNSKDETNREFSSSQVLEYVIVGNTAMHHIFLGLPVNRLGKAPFTPVLSDPYELNAEELGLISSNSAKTFLLPNVAGFIGADHIAMLLSAGAMKEEKTTLYMDIGTNTEIALFHHGEFISCSTASGPAFEGAHIKDGMRAADGAIEHVKIESDTVLYQTIGDVKPIGICGSGIVDLIAELLDAEIINGMGAFDNQYPLVEKGEKGLELIIVPASDSGHDREITLTRKDISEIQLAKGAIQAGISLLLKEVSLGIEQIEKIVVAGAFGTYLDIESAIRIGLIPDIEQKNITQIGNAAGIGAKWALMSKKKRAEAIELKNRIRHLELSNHPEFSAEFTKAMRFDN